MEYKILVVDDEEMNRDILQDFLDDKYNVDTAEDGDIAIQKIKEHGDEYVAMLLDIQMPRVDGFKVLETLKEMNLVAKIPVLVITGERSVSNEKKCFDMGASDFIHKPFEPYLVLRRVENIVSMSMNQRYLETKVESQTRIVKNQYNLLKKQTEKLEETNNKIIEILGTVVEYRNVESGEHINRVKSFTRIIAEHVMKECPQYSLNSKKVDMIVSASPLHDIGKIAIPDAILLKPGKLTEEEYEFMKSHTTRGCSILDSIHDIWDDDYRKTAYEICRFHHERYDGKGYPDNLKGESIPISAQIVAVADVYDALISERIYKTAYSYDKAYLMIVNGECGIFSPYILECFRNSKEELEQLVN